MENFFIDSFMPSLGIIVVLLGIPFGLLFLKKANSTENNKDD